MADRADERATSTYDRVGDQRSGGSDGRLMVAERRRLLELGVTAQRADAVGAVGVGSVQVETGDVVDVNQRRRASEAQLHHWDEALTAGKHFGIVGRPEDLDRLGERRRCFIVKAGWIHIRTRFLFCEWAKKLRT